MELFFASFLAFALSILAMAVGVLFGRARLKGSCAGLAGLCDGAGLDLCEPCPNRRANADRADTASRR